MRKYVAMASAAVALCLAASNGAMADSRGYVIANWAPAMNNPDDTNCPQGKNAQAADIMTYSLKANGMPADQAAKLADPNTFSRAKFGQFAPMRGRKDGKEVLVYNHPLTAPDPHIHLDVSKEAFGFNMDGKVGPNDYTDPLTKEKGVDNAAARVFGCFDRTRGTLDNPPGNWSYRWSHYNEGNTWLMEISTPANKPLTFQNDDNVTVNFYRGMQLPLKNGSGYQKNVTYTIDPNRDLTKLTSFKGKISNGMFMADVTPEFRMIASSRIQPIFDFKQVRLRISMKPDGNIRGFMAGYLPIDMIYFPFGDYGVGAEYCGGMDVSGLYQALIQNADTDLDADPKTHRRTRISQTYQIEAVPAYLRRVSAAN